ncbi:MAG: hypothetical protein A2651_02210 [Candidatus Yanofskybacteria bacterium RIFCSPHIGHO2_01_FULL_42_12]|uniref:Uncharacterized protein n=1 Tax=Candidatus Yanofskybacteria bacterium RIFCSPLOWO2_01_FULL_42_49 TaxID=1802694 RepID=A0A1F8GE81_9BACT|nr:MAG: hypothetical protein A2651_02210 [Candidatus Yanofskybacteria bacterium RIFCSPHIGHO2_01_FULL_42_12]OGN22769.1 MAG: hypothetical protein A2918_01365 [Candidatus Yanofskybacteria bacterium RIFCSPLOWO2_01_FULL_42_49]
MKASLVVIILVVFVVIGFLWWQTTQKQPSETQGGLGSELYQNTENPAENLPAVNPLENKPEVNPLSDTNPFSDIKTNPFK